MRFKCLIATQHVGSSAHGCFELELCAPRHDLILNIIDIDWFKPWSHAMYLNFLPSRSPLTVGGKCARAHCAPLDWSIDDTERAILSDLVGNPIEPLGARYSGWASPDDNTWNIPRALRQNPRHWRVQPPLTADTCARTTRALPPVGAVAVVCWHATRVARGRLRDRMQALAAAADPPFRPRVLP